MRILFLDSAHPYLQQELEKMGFICDINLTDVKEEVENNVALYDGIIIRSRFQIDAPFLDKSKQLKFIARVGAGMENIDVAYAEKKGIVCLHAPEGNRDAVAEHALAMLLCLFNNLCKVNQETRAGKWIREKNRGVELMGKTVGIIGYGNTGSAFAERLKGFSVQVLAYDKYKNNYASEHVVESSIERIFKEADVVSFHVPLTAETHYMANDNFIKKFHKNIYLINTSRGKVVKTDDLVRNLKSGKIKGACLDVLEYEDVSFEKLVEADLSDPLSYLIKSDKVILSPHIAGWTHESNYKLAKVLVDRIRKLFSL